MWWIMIIEAKVACVRVGHLLRPYRYLGLKDYDTTATRVVDCYFKVLLACSTGEAKQSKANLRCIPSPMASP